MREGTRASHCSSLDREWELVVVGAGPGGAVAACRGAQMGLRTLLVDRAVFPRNKVCGSCLSPVGIGALRGIGIDEGVVKAGAALERVEIHARGRSMVMPLASGGVAIGRERLDGMLIDCARVAGAVVMEGTSARLVCADAHESVIALVGKNWEKEIRAKVVIGADGLAGTFLARDARWKARVSRWSRVGLGARVDDVVDTARGLSARGAVVMHVARGGYVGMVRLSDGTLDVAAAVAPWLVRECGGASKAIGRVLQESGVECAEVIGGRAWHGTAALTRKRAVERGSVFLIGDAAGYVEPFAGDGMSCAIWGGIAAAEHARAWMAGDVCSGAWGARYGAMFGSGQRRCSGMALCLRSPWLVSALACGIAARPSLGGWVRGLFTEAWDARRGSVA